MGAVIPSEATSKAKEAWRRAFELDDTLAEVHYTSALIKTWGDWDWEGGEAAFKRALELNPNYPDARVYYSNLLCYLGRYDEAVAQGEQALALDPLNSLFMGIYGLTLGMVGRYDDAASQARNALKTSPNDPPGHSMLWEVLHLKGDYEGALAEANAFYGGLGLSPIVDAMATGYEANGYSGAMRAAAETLVAISQQTYVGPFLIAYLYVAAGDRDRAIEWLEKGYEMRDPNIPYIGGCGMVDTFLHDDLRFQDLLRRINLPGAKRD
jgi:adenylate cyclase